MQTFPHVIFDGNCEQALRFYAELFGGEVSNLMRYSDAPANMPMQADPALVMHARLTVGGSTVLSANDAMTADAGPHYLPPAAFSIAVNTHSVAENERLFKALATGGSVQCPLCVTFWSASFGMCKCRFGVPWMLNCQVAP